MVFWNGGWHSITSAFRARYRDLFVPVSEEIIGNRRLGIYFDFDLHSAFFWDATGNTRTCRFLIRSPAALLGNWIRCTWKLKSNASQADGKRRHKRLVNTFLTSTKGFYRFWTLHSQTNPVNVVLRVLKSIYVDENFLFAICTDFTLLECYICM